MATLEEDIRLRTKVTLYIHFSFEELEDVSLISVKLLAEHVEVRDWCLRGDESGLGHFAAFILRLFFLLTGFLIHDSLDSVEQLRELIAFVPLDIPIEALWSSLGRLSLTSLNRGFLLFLLLLRFTEVHLDVFLLGEVGSNFHFFYHFYLFFVNTVCTRQK